MSRTTGEISSAYASTESAKRTPPAVPFRPACPWITARAAAGASTEYVGASDAGPSTVIHRQPRLSESVATSRGGRPFQENAATMPAIAVATPSWIARYAVSGGGANQ